MSDSPTHAVNPLPPAVIVLFLIIVIGEAYIAGAEARLWGSFDARIALMRQFAFMPEGLAAPCRLACGFPSCFGGC